MFIIHRSAALRLHLTFFWMYSIKITVDCSCRSPRMHLSVQAGNRHVLYHSPFQPCGRGDPSSLSFIEINFCPSNFLRSCTCGTSKPFSIKITKKRQEGTTPLHSPAMLEMSFSPVLHADKVLQLDLNIPKFDALTLNTSASCVRLEMSTRTQNCTHLPTCS